MREFFKIILFVKSITTNNNIISINTVSTWKERLCYLEIGKYRFENNFVGPNQNNYINSRTL